MILLCGLVLNRLQNKLFMDGSNFLDGPYKLVVLTL